MRRSARRSTCRSPWGEHFGDRWDVNELIENNWMDYSRVSIPNSGGITEFMKIAALCETHYVGLIPHFTGPIGEAALVHLLRGVLGADDDGDDR